MVSMNYKQTLLTWDPDRDSDRTFNVIALFTSVSFLALGILIASIQVPKNDRAEQTAIPERIARYIAERSRPEPIPETRPQPVQPPKSELQIQRPAPEVRKPLTKVEEKARKSAQGSGLLALSKELSALTDTSGINSMVAKKINTSPTNTAAATVDTRILTSDTGRKSSGVRQDAHVGNVGATNLVDNQQQLAQGLLAANNGKTASPAGKPTTQGHGTNARGDEDVAVVMDQYKSILYSVYNRARRSNPGLKGKIVLVITILPSGQVSNVVIKSSELNSPDLEASIVARVRQFEFGTRQGGPLTVTVPVEFLPS